MRKSKFRESQIVGILKDAESGPTRLNVTNEPRGDRIQRRVGSIRELVRRSWFGSAHA